MKAILMLIAALVMGAASAWASSDVGQTELNLIVILFTGKIGLTLGLGVVIMGIWMIIQGKGGGGIFIIVLGVLITMLPGVYKGFRAIACPIAESLGGSCSSYSDGPTG